jgi:hypothetical protein
MESVDWAQFQFSPLAGTYVQSINDIPEKYHLAGASLLTSFWEIEKRQV